MCGRFTTPDEQTFQKVFGFAPPTDYQVRFNLAPSQNLYAFCAPKKLSVLRWGLVPFWAKDPSIENRSMLARRASPYNWWGASTEPSRWWFD